MDLNVYTEKIKKAVCEYLSIFPDSTFLKKLYSNSFNSYGVDVYNREFDCWFRFLSSGISSDSNIWEYLKLRYHENMISRHN